MTKKVTHLIAATSLIALLAAPAPAHAAYPTSFKCEDRDNVAPCSWNNSAGWILDSSAGNFNNHLYIDSTRITLNEFARWTVKAGDLPNAWGGYYTISVYIFGATYPSHFSSTSVKYYWDGSNNLGTTAINQGAIKTDRYVQWGPTDNFWMADGSSHTFSTDGYCGPCIGMSYPFRSGVDAAWFAD